MDRREFLVSAGVAALSAAGCAARAASAAPKKSVEDTPVILEVAISGTNSKKINPLVPESAEEQIAEFERLLFPEIFEKGTLL